MLTEIKMPPFPGTEQLELFQLLPPPKHQRPSTRVTKTPFHSQDLLSDTDSEQENTHKAPCRFGFRTPPTPKEHTTEATAFEIEWRRIVRSQRKPKRRSPWSTFPPLSRQTTATPRPPPRPPDQPYTAHNNKSGKISTATLILPTTNSPQGPH